MNTSQTHDNPAAQHIDSGDVIEIDRDGAMITVLVLLAAEQALILDALDGTTPFVVLREELGTFRKYEPIA